MNKQVLILAIIGALSANALAQSTVLSLTNSTPATIADGNPVGITEQFNMTGLTGSIMDVQVQLNIAGGFNGDLYAYLSSPLGQFSVLLNRAGLSSGNPVGYSDAGFQITLDGIAGSDIHNYQAGSYTLSGGQLTGTWAADGRNINPQSPGSTFDSTSPTATLGLYNGLDASAENGAWTLFIADVASGGGSPVLNQAVLTIVTIPEPTTLALAATGLLAGWWMRRRHII